MDDVAGLRALFSSDQAWMRDEVVERDLTVFRRARRRLRDVFEYGTSGRDADAVTELNALLEAFPVQPRISGHDASDWHMHVTSRGASVSAEYLAGAVWGLSVWLCEYGSARFGIFSICADCAANRNPCSPHQSSSRSTSPMFHSSITVLIVMRRGLPSCSFASASPLGGTPPLDA